MGANSSKHRYEYNYDDPTRSHNYYVGQRGANFMQQAPYYGQVAGVIPQGYPGIYPQPGIPRIIYPAMAYPMQQILGPPVGQGQQSLPQQQPAPQSQVPVMPGNGMPTNPMPPLPIPQMPQPAMQSSFQPQPQPQYPLSNGPPNAMPEATVPDYGRVPAAQGSARVIPRSFTRVSPSTSTSDSSSSSSSGTRRATDPLARNPLPALPREAETPADMLAGSAMAHAMPPPPRSSSPLKNPLPPPPRDIYTLKKYRPLLVGTAYQDREKEVFPRGWFSDEYGHEREGSLGRVFDRLNPFKSHRSPGYSPGHRRHETMPDLPRLPEFMRDTSTGSDSSFEPQQGRRNKVGRPFTSRWRRRDDERGMQPLPMGGPLPPTADGQPPVGFMPISSPAVPGPQGQPQPMHPLSPGPAPAQAGPLATPGPQPQPAVPLTPGPRAMPQPVIPVTPGPPQPQPSIHPTPRAMPQPEIPLTSGPAGPRPAHPLSPGSIPRVFAGQGPNTPNSNRGSNPPELRFRQDTPGYGGFCHLSPHRVHYMGKLYPTAANLFEAFRFLGTRNDLAKHVRKATFDELGELLERLAMHTRPDWEEILFDKMEEALYHKFVQHADLCDLLLDTGITELIYDEPTDPFWGTGEHEEGSNELGRALMRVRDRLRQEATNH